MNSVETQSRPLQLTPPMWWMLGLVALLLVARLWNSPRNGNDGADSVPFTVTRHEGGEHRFYSLGLKIDLPPGWVYLAWIDANRAQRLTLAHPASHSIVRVVPNLLKEWPPQESVLQDQSNASDDNRLVRRQYAHAVGEWVPLTRRVRIPVIDEQGNRDVYLWETIDHRRLGRLHHGDQDVILIAMTHRHGTPLTDAVHQLCDSIEFVQ